MHNSASYGFKTTHVCLLCVSGSSHKTHLGHSTGRDFRQISAPLCCVTSSSTQERYSKPQSIITRIPVLTFNSGRPARLTLRTIGPFRGASRCNRASVRHGENMRPALGRPSFCLLVCQTVCVSAWAHDILMHIL